MKSQSVPHPNHFEACREAAARAFETVASLRGKWAAKLALPTVDVERLQAQLTKAEEATHEYHRGEALELWEAVAKGVAELLERTQQSLSGRFAVTPEIFRRAQKLASQAQAARAKWLQTTQREARKNTPRLFDAGYYLSQLTADTPLAQDPWQHYARQGWKEGRDPHPLFSTAWYLKQNPDVAAAEVEPFGHFLGSGWKEGRAPHPWFNLRWYLRHHPDVADSGLDPLQHYALHGWKEKRDPNPVFALGWYLEQNPDVAAAQVEPLSHFLSTGWKEGQQPNPNFDTANQLLWNQMEENPGPATFPKHLALSAGSLTDSASVVSDHFGRQCDVLRVFPSPGLEPRLNVVVDRLASDLSTDATVPALIMGVLLAEKHQMALRIVTRLEEAKPGALLEILSVNHVTCNRNVQFAFASVNRDSDGLDVSDKDFFITTSWATTWSVTQSIDKQKVMWLVQDDERTLLGEGDAKLRCQQMLSDKDLFHLVSTRLLHHHLAQTGSAHLEKSGAWFEPAFPSPAKAASQPLPLDSSRKTFVFHATPDDSRTLLGLGLEVIDAAIAESLIDHPGWNFVFVGSHLRPMVLVNDIHPIILQNPKQSHLAEILKATDLCLSLMLAPHPGSMTLRAASAGAAVVTTRFGNKSNLSEYSPNILCAAPDKRSLLDAFRKAVASPSTTPSQSDWSSSFAKALGAVSARFGLNA